MNKGEIRINFNEKVLNLMDNIDHVMGTRKELPDKNT